MFNDKHVLVHANYAASFVLEVQVVQPRLQAYCFLYVSSIYLYP
jgi:hypothetical protein